jgi:hypothetical protein
MSWTLRHFAGWCQQHQLRLFPAAVDIEFFARDLKARGRARATITRRLCTLAGRSWAGTALTACLVAVKPVAGTATELVLEAQCVSASR